MVWRSRYEESDPKCTVPTVKHGGGSVMVWSCFTKTGVGKLCILDRILLSANIGRESVTINTAIRTWDEFGIYP